MLHDGDPIGNRARQMFEVIDAAIEVWGADRFGYIARELCCPRSWPSENHLCF